MPAVGEQHNNAPANPFEDVKPRISEYTAAEIATLQSRLQKQLGPEYISSRKGPGGKNVHYIASEKVIGLANEVFGFNGWSSTIRDIQVDFVDENVQTRKVDIGLSVIVRVTLKDGTYHEDIGYGHIENCSGKAAAFEKAKKEGTTDALKRSLRNFGNVLGNCVYDKDYLAKVTKIKVKSTKFDENNLFRHPDHANAATQMEPAKPAPNPAIAAAQVAETNGAQPASRRNSVQGAADDEFGSADFDEADFSFADLDHPDEMVIDQPRQVAPAARNMHPPHIPLQNQPGPPRPPGLATNGVAMNGRPQSVPAQGGHAPRPQISGPNQPPMQARAQSTYIPQSRPNGVPGQPMPGQSIPPAQSGPSRPGQPQIPSNVSRPGNAPIQGQRPPQQPQQQQPQQQQAPPFEQPIPPGAPTGFLSAKAAGPVQNGAGTSAQLPQFNPRAESPSIRKTAGVDHTKSMGIKRAHVLGEDTQGGRPGQTDMGRRIGAPGTAPSPLANRGQFKPVGISAKRPADGMGPPQPQNRTALNDVTATSINAPAAPPQEPDPKRPRLDAEGVGPGPPVAGHP